MPFIQVVANMSGESVGVKASIPSLEVTGNYNLSASLALFSLDGADELLLNITNLQFSAIAQFEQASGETLQITSINASVKVKNSFNKIIIIPFLVDNICV